VSGEVWTEPVRHPALAEGEVHVWRARLDTDADRRAMLATLLSADERERAGRFVFDRDRDRYVVGRGSLRMLLGRYLETPPAQLRFTYGPRGKPALAAGAPALPHFNLAHSGDLAVYALALERDVGVDVEAVRPDFATDAIARRFFSPHEVAALRALSAAQRVTAFFSCWTRKEAYIKAQGDGLSLPLDSFDVTLGPDVPAALVSTRPDTAEASRWSLAALTPGDGYAGAVVTAGSDWQLRCWDLRAI
jgi:4'-phosphopantetheinyl transferase